MRTRFLLLGASCLVATSATAADVLPYIEPVYTTPLYDWNGFYVGVNAGYGGGNFEHPFQIIGPDENGEYPDPEEPYPEEPYPEGPYEATDDLPDPGPGQIILATGSADVTAGGFLFGVQGGYNWQFDPNFLIGIEGDIQGTNIEGRVSVSITDETGALLMPGDSLDAELGTNLDWFATIRPRIGWVNDRFVVYATGGLAWGQTTSSITATLADSTLIDESITNDRFGWTIGAGIEYALFDNITFKTEYLYTDLGSEQIVDLDFGEGYNFAMNSDVKFHVVRAGLNFQF